ncbi:MAG TPA: DinB family protein, partial [Terriglobales bacterium]|nr:DinB family protein [Terriglobales bacterium]
SWTLLPTQVVQSRIEKLRGELIGVVISLRQVQLERTGFHPVLGEMNIVQWLEFFLLHEAHHLYAILFRLRESA